MNQFNAPRPILKEKEIEQNIMYQSLDYETIL